MQPEDIDKLFRDRLADHAPPPPAYLWNQLEEELQPAKKRPAMWLWAAAASLVLLLVSGILWLQTSSVRTTGPGPLATTTRLSKAGQPPAAWPAQNSAAATVAQATPPRPLASSPSEAPGATPPAVLSPRPQGAHPRARQLAAAPVAGSRSRRLAPANRPTRAAASPEGQPAAPAPEAVASLAPKTQPERSSFASEPRQLPPTALAAAPPAAPTGPIEVEVRHTNETATAPKPRPSLGGLLLRQARNVVRGDRVSLAEAGLPETVTVQARVGGRTLTKVIQL